MDIKEEMKLHQWARDMADQKASGMSRKQWCEMKGISFSTYDYHCRKVRKAMADKLQENSTPTAIVPSEKVSSPADTGTFFARVDLSPAQNTASGINIRFHDILVNIAPDAQDPHVRMVLEVLSHAQ